MLQIYCHSFQKCVGHWKTNYWSLWRFSVYFTCGTRPWDIFYFFYQLFVVRPQWVYISKSWSNLSLLGWANWRWSFRASCFSDLVLVTVKVTCGVAGYMCCSHAYFCLNNFVPSDLCFDRLHILLAFHIHQGSFCHCRTFWFWSPVLVYSMLVRRVTIWIDVSVDCELPYVFVCTVRVFISGIQNLAWLFLSCFILF